MKKVLIVLIISICYLTIQAQNQTKGQFKRISIDAYAGLPVFYGDIKNKFGGYNATARVNWNLTSAVSIGTEFSYGNIKGLDKDAEASYFTNNYLKAMIGGELYFFNPFKFSQITNWFQPYVGLNLGIIKSGVSKSGSYEGESANYHKKINFAHQWHIGGKVKLSNSLDLNLRYCYAPVKTDEFDNLNPSVPANKSNDLLTNFELGISYHIGGKGKTPIIWYADNQPLIEPSELLIEDVEIENTDNLNAKIDAVNRKRMENEVNLTLEIDKVRYENNQLKTQIKDLNEKIDALIITKPKPNTQTSSSMPIEAELYQAFLEGPSKDNYFVVCGSYKVLDLALERVNQLNQKGYTPIIMREPATDLHRVVLATAVDYEEALQFLTKYRKQIDPTAWIIKMKKD